MGALRPLLKTICNLDVASASREQCQRQECLFVMGVQIDGSLQSLSGLVVQSGRLKHHPQQMIDLGTRSILPELLFADLDRLRMARCAGKRQRPGGPIRRASTSCDAELGPTCDLGSDKFCVGNGDWCGSRTRSLTDRPLLDDVAVGGRAGAASWII